MGVDKFLMCVGTCLISLKVLAPPFSFFTKENSPGEVTSHSGVSDQHEIQTQLLLNELTTQILLPATCKPAPVSQNGAIGSAPKVWPPFLGQ